MPDTSKPGELKVHLDGVPNDAAYWVLALGPVNNGLYDWAIVSDNLSVSLFILARDYKRFDELYQSEVLSLAESMGFKNPIDVHQADDCVYSSTTRARQIQDSMKNAVVTKCEI
jgi:lipocalin